MRRAVALVAVALGIPAGTLLLSRWWYAHPDYFPRLPAGLWASLDRWFAADNVDKAADVERLVVVLVALTLVASLTAALWALWWLAARRPRG